MLLVLQLLMFVVLALVLWKGSVLIKRLMDRRRAPKLKCETCRYCDVIDQDGVMCRYGATVTLKTLANVNMCMDYLPAERKRRR